MNVIGIDYQWILSVIGLREGHAPKWPPVSVGDGKRPLIPHAVTSRGLWGSDALAHLPSERWGGIETSGDGPWIEEPGASTFWHGLSRRLRAFLGGIDPAQYLSQIVVALLATDFPGSAAQVRALCSQAGLGEPLCIAAGQAALVAALQESSQMRLNGSGFPEVTAIVVAGDRGMQVVAYRLTPEGSQRRVIAATSPISISQTGLAFWVQEVAQAVWERCAERVTTPYIDPAMWQAAMEFGARLTDLAHDEQVLQWTGPLHEKMPVPLHFSRRACAQWASVQRLFQELPVALRRTAQAVGGRQGPNLIVLTGVGATWPFVAAAAARVGPVVTVESPELSIARGAAWWPEIGEAIFANCSGETTETGPVMEHDERPTALSPAVFPPMVSSGEKSVQGAERPPAQSASSQPAAHELDWHLLREHST